MIDFEKVKVIYKLGRKLNLSDVQVLLQSAIMKSFPSGEFLLKEGGIKKEVFFIRKGLVRAFKINDKGDEITTFIKWENQILASPDIILFNEPSQLYFKTIEPTDVLSMDYDVIQTIISNNPKLEANRKFILQNILKEAILRINSFILYSPEERYLKYIEANPGIVHRVPDKYIANILGITPVSLSRIRKRIATTRK
ncbi:MAG: Crp/Fnr family transcriptional regulator [Bacteroidota bacterium]